MRVSIRFLGLSFGVFAILSLALAPAMLLGSSPPAATPPEAIGWMPDVSLRDVVDLYAAPAVSLEEARVDPAEQVMVEPPALPVMPPARRYMIQPRRP